MSKISYLLGILVIFLNKELNDRKIFYIFLIQKILKLVWIV